jgi:anaerobic magnesium-protoporphyrin IX monomethyl ester cyclase
MSSKILLVHPYVPMSLQYGTRYHWAGAVLPPLGILYVAGVLEQEGYEVHILDANAQAMETAAVLEHVKQLKPDVMGMTGTSLSYTENLRIAEGIKAWMPDLPIVLGGVHAQGLPEACAATGLFDYVIPGEGELTFLKLVKALENGNSVEPVGGIYFMKDGEVINTGAGELVENLDDLPFPARHLLHDMNSYHQKAFAYRKMPNTSIFTQRGCPFGCIFCSSSQQFRTLFDKKVRAHSVDYVRREIEELVNRWGVREVYFADDTFNLLEDRVFEICDMFQTHFPNLTWSCNFEANIASKKMMKALKDAGCWLIQIGVETGNEEVMKTIKKGIKLEQVSRVCEMAAKEGLAIKTSFILGNPSETRETVEETIQFAESLPAHYITFSLMAPLPGSPFWDTAGDYGEFDKTAFDKFSMVGSNFIPNGLTSEFLQQKQKEAHKRVFLRPKMIKRHLPFIKSPRDLFRYTLGFASMLR